MNAPSIQQGAKSCQARRPPAGQGGPRRSNAQPRITSDDATRAPLLQSIASVTSVAIVALSGGPAWGAVDLSFVSPARAEHGVHQSSKLQLLPAPELKATPLQQHVHETGEGGHVSAAPAAPAFKCTPAESQMQAYAASGFNHSTATQSPKAQALINQGLLLAWDFNQTESRRAFEQAVQVDPSSAFAHWGLAYSRGPFLNKAAVAPPADGSYPVFSQQELEEGRQAVNKGLALVEKQILTAKLALLMERDDASQLDRLDKDKTYLLALAPVFRSPQPHGPAFTAANNLYAQRLEEWAQCHPDDVDALALAAEALANNQPWDFWTHLSPGDPTVATPKGETEHMVALLDRALKVEPSHPLAAHLLIHATEDSTPEGARAAESAADAMGQRFSSFGHLVHMPSHTYLHVGRWHDAVVSNLRAMELDEQHAAACLQPDYPGHNAAMGIYAAAEGAEQATAEAMATRLQRFPEVFGPTYMSEGRERLTLPMYVQLRFANWAALAGLRPSDVDPSQDGVMLPANTTEYNQAMYHFINAMTTAASAAAGPQAAPPASLVALPASLQGGSSTASAAISGLPLLESQAPAVLTEGSPPPSLGHPKAPQAPVWLQRNEEALRRLEAAVAALPEDAPTRPGTGLGLYSPAWKLQATHALKIAQARRAVLDQDWAAATGLLQEAVGLEAQGGYYEPPRFFQPQGECLAWVLLQQGRLAEAAEAYSKVLVTSPRSPWALQGLRDVHAARGALPGGSPALPEGTLSAAQVEAQLKEIMSDSGGAAVELPSSCPMFSRDANRLG